MKVFNSFHIYFNGISQILHAKSSFNKSKVVSFTYDNSILTQDIFDLARTKNTTMYQHIPKVRNTTALNKEQVYQSPDINTGHFIGIYVPCIHSPSRLKIWIEGVSFHLIHFVSTARGQKVYRLCLYRSNIVLFAFRGQIREN